MDQAVPSTSTSAPAVQEARRGPRRAARAVVDHTLTERHRAAVERLEQLADDIVAKLDLLDRDPDLEDGADEEMWLGAPEPQGGYVQRGYGRMDQSHWNDGASDDREQDDEREASLGSIGSNANAELVDQRRWASGGTSDLEDEHDGREPVCEDEGAQCEDEGGACEDEGAATGDDEGDAQASCHWFPDHPSPWPPRPGVIRP